MIIAENRCERRALQRLFVLLRREQGLRFLIREQHHAIAVEQHDSVLNQSDRVEQMTLIVVQAGSVGSDLARQLVEFLGERAELIVPRDFYFAWIRAGCELFVSASQNRELFQN